MIEECEALSRAVNAFHMEGIRFRIYNVDRLLAQHAAVAAGRGASSAGRGPPPPRGCRLPHQVAPVTGAEATAALAHLRIGQYNQVLPMNNSNLTHLSDLDMLEAAIAESLERPVLLFKHSRTCGISCEALDELQAHVGGERRQGRPTR